MSLLSYRPWLMTAVIGFVTLVLSGIFSELGQICQSWIAHFQNASHSMPRSWLPSCKCPKRKKKNAHQHLYVTEQAHKYTQNLKYIGTIIILVIANYRTHAISHAKIWNDLSIHIEMASMKTVPEVNSKPYSTQKKLLKLWTFMNTKFNSKLNDTYSICCLGVTLPPLSLGV